METFNSQGWERISNRCVFCGIDRYYTKPVLGNNGQIFLNTKQFHHMKCPELKKTTTMNKSNLPLDNVVDIEFKEIKP